MKLQNKRLNEKKAQNTDKLNKLNSLIKEEYTIEYGWENPQQEDKEPYWLSNEELRFMADKLIRRFGNEKDFEDFYYKAQEYAEGYISEDALSAFAVCDIDEMDDEETYNKTIDEFIAAVWEIKDEDFHLTESMKKAKKKLMKESKELRLIKLFRTNNRNIKVVGYFGEATWEETKNFVERINGAWRLPTIDEGKEILYQFGKKMEKIAIADMSSKGIWVDSNSEKGYCVFADGGEGYRKNSNIFLIR